ncbi:methionyl-tRNA ligase, partial [Ochrobactrum sp. CDB2]
MSPLTFLNITLEEAGFLMSREKFYITTAIAYPNGKPHIGHAYE